MKTTVKLDTTKGIQVVQEGQRITANLQTFGVNAFSFNLDKTEAQQIGYALIEAAQAAEQAGA